MFGFLNFLKPIGNVMTAKAKADAQSRGNQVAGQVTSEDINARNRRDYNDANLSSEKLRTDQQQQLFDQMIAKLKEQRESGNNAYQNVLRTDYAINRKPLTSVPLVGGKSLSIAPMVRPELSAEAKAGMGAFRAEALSRLNPGGATTGSAPGAPPTSNAQGMPMDDRETWRIAPAGNYQYQPPVSQPMPGVDAIEKPGAFSIDPKLLKPGRWETILGMAGAGLAGLPDSNGTSSTQQTNNTNGTNGAPTAQQTLFDKMYQRSRGRVPISA